MDEDGYLTHVHDIGRAVSGLMGAADLLERAGERRIADLLRSLAMQIDEGIGAMLSTDPPMH